MQTNSADSPAAKTLWVVAHERDDPMVLVQAQYPEAEAFEVLKRMIRERVGEGVHVDPRSTTEEIGRRYDVHDGNGWLATYWLAEEQIANDDGMLTAIVGPGARQRTHHTVRRSS